MADFSLSTPTLAEQRDRAAAVTTILRELYPEARCSLTFSTPFELLVATMLSAQCTDERVNLVTATLFQKYPDVEAFANADPATLESDIKSINFYRNKAKNIREAARQIVSRFGGEVPGSVEELVSLPGVARKTANVTLGNALGVVEGIVVDTHVGRVSRRLGFTQSEDPIQVEQDLLPLFPREDWVHISHLLIFHGRAVCQARKPLCEQCRLAPLCPTGQANLGTVNAPAFAPADAAPVAAKSARTKKRA